MLLTTKGRYAVMAMVDLAVQRANKPVTLATIAERQQIPLAYLEQLFAKLRKAELVEAVRGPGGGYRLSLAVEDIFVSEVIEASGEAIKMTRCGDLEKPHKANNQSNEQGCMHKGGRCLTHDLWDGLSEHIYRYLAAISLEDVCLGRFPEVKITPLQQDSLVRKAV